jgi:hypothetical protein
VEPTPGLDDLVEMPGVTDPEARRLLGLFDLPAFVRRGQDLDWLRSRVLGRVSAEREERLAMVRMRLRQWAAGATSANDGDGALEGPVGALVEACGGPVPAWAGVRGTAGRRRRAARDLAASVARFNARWRIYLETLDLGPINRQIDMYNRYYVIEKECSLGSARLAHRHFEPVGRWSLEGLLVWFPPLPEVRAAR